MMKEYTPILPFDATQNDQFVIYDKTTYVCRIDQYQTEKPVKLHHSSMVKYYNCSIDEEPVRLGGDGK